MQKSSLRKGLRAAAATGGLVATITVMTAGTAGAVGPHQHSVTNPSGSHNIANGFCNGNFAVGTPQNQAITNFHERIHVGSGGPEGVVTIGGGACAP